MTSNLGSEYLLSGEKDMVSGLLKQTFKPEFLNRIDEVIYFNPLNKESQIKIIDKLLNILKARLYEEHYYIDFTDKVKGYIINNSFSPEYGARPLKRFIQREIETFLSKQILSEKLEVNKKYFVDIENDMLTIKEY